MKNLITSNTTFSINLPADHKHPNQIQVFPSSFSITVFLPNRDKQGNLIYDIDRWVDKFSNLFIDIFSGMTISFCDGWYKNQSHKIMKEKTVTVSAALFQVQALQNFMIPILELITEFAINTNQESVLISLNGNLKLVEITKKR